MRISPMPVERQHSLPRVVYRLWAGLECGVLAGSIGLVWFAFHALVHGDYWWSKFNIAAGWFYDMAVYRAGLSWVTLAGASVLMVFYCLAGALFAFGWNAFSHPRAFLVVPFYVAGVHFFAAYCLWPSFGPFARLWFPWTATAPVHFVLFVILMRYPILYLRLVDGAGEPGWLPREPPPPPADAAEAQPPGAAFGATECASSPVEPPKD
jgi:hypothetical protein